MRGVVSDNSIQTSKSNSVGTVQTGGIFRGQKTQPEAIKGVQNHTEESLQGRPEYVLYRTLY